MTAIYQQAVKAAEFLKSKTEIVPRVVLVLGSGLGDYSFTQNHSSCIRAARETLFRNARQFGAGRASAARTEAT